MANVSVVIATRDRPELLSRTVASVRGQVGVDVELIVVDDGSVRPIRMEGAIVIHHERSRGVAAARNAGIERASAPYVALLDDDDLWAPSKLAEQLASGGDWVYSATLVVDEQLRPLWLERPTDVLPVREALSRMNVVTGGASSVCARRELLVELGGFDPTFDQLADWDMWLRLADASIPATCERVHVAYVLHSGNMVLRDPLGPERELERLAQKHRIEPDRATVARWIAWHQLRRGNRMTAARIYATSGLRDGNPGNLVRGMAAMGGLRRPHRRPPAPSWLPVAHGRQ